MPNNNTNNLCEKIKYTINGRKRWRLRGNIILQNKKITGDIITKLQSYTQTTKVRTLTKIYKSVKKNYRPGDN